jgi:dolichyl-phosphate-mannose-protein mannosyltransferase
MKKKYIYLVAVLGVIVLFGVGLHFFRIGYPAWPVFDEAHFATYAGDYVMGHPFLDIHPPLGKFIFASVLWFYPRSALVGAQYLKTGLTPQGQYTLSMNNIPYGDFPYLALRVTSAFFGILLAVAMYYFMKNLGTGEVAAFLAAIFITFDNAFLTVSRLILMDGMFMAFAVIGLAIYFGKRRRPVVAGIFWGLALSVKLTAIIFIGPVLVGYLLVSAAERRKEFNSIVRFMVAGFAVLILIAFAGTFVFSAAERLQVLAKIGTVSPTGQLMQPGWQAAHPAGMLLLADINETAFSLGNYVVGNFHEGESPWYFWPAMQTPIAYYNPHPGDAGGSIVFVGNPTLWLAATMAVIAAIVVLLRHAKARIRRQDLEKKDRKPLFILLGGYVSGMLPFILIVHRSTFLYHYLPALIFGFGLLAWMLTKWLAVHDWDDFTPRKAFFLSVALVFVLAGFLATAPFTYGL